MRRGARGEEGYALVAAVASIAVFAGMALAVLSATQTVAGDASAEQAQLQAGAAADAGVAMTLSKLLSHDATERWGIDGRERGLRYGDFALRVRIEDERGKVPINLLDEQRATRLLEAVGLAGDRLLIARDSLLDWTDSDDLARPFGAERGYYAAAGIVPANGFLGSIEELRSIRGFDAATVERLRPIATAFTAVTAFDPHFANPRALAVMADAGDDASVQALERARDLAGQRTALDFAATTDLTRRPLTVLVTARLADGTGASRRVVLQLTGTPAAPYVVIASD